MRIKKVVLSSVLAMGMLSASSSYEAGLSVGLNALGNLDSSEYSLQATLSLKDYSFLDGKVIPRVDFEYSSIDESALPATDSSYRLAVNGIYDFAGNSLFQPYALGGFGYEIVDKEDNTYGFTNQGFGQLGIGAKYAVSDSFGLKLEAKGLKTFSEGVEFQLYVGAVIPFGGAEVASDDDVVALVDTAEPVVEANVIEQANVTEEVKPQVQEIVVTDSDNDGIADDSDKCINTPANYINQVDANGCVAEFRLKVNFDANQYYLKSKYSSDVAKFAQYLKDFPKYNAQIKGHASTDLTTHVGIKLSENRAKSVKNALVNLGVSSDRLKTIGVGGYQPIASNKTEAGKIQNRRVEVKVFRP